MPLTTEFVQSHCEIVESLPQPNWKTLYEWSQTNRGKDSWHEFWGDLIRLWLGALAKSLNEDYQVTESNECFLLSGRSVPDAKSLLTFIDSTFHRIGSLLPPGAPREKFGPRLVVVFDEPEAYYSYLSRYFSDGHHIASAAVQIRQGYLHIVVNNTDRALRRHLIHEMVHLHLAEFSTPRWLEEALAQYLPQFMLGEPRFHMDAEFAARHRAFWRKSTLEPFWRGVSFKWIEDGSELSYHLSEVLLRNLISDFPSRVPEFVQSAKRADAGAAAARVCFGRSLGQIVSGFLGGDAGLWEPQTIPLSENGQADN